MATHCSVLACRIPGMAEPGGRLSMGSHRVRHDWSDLAAAAAAAAAVEQVTRGRKSLVRHWLGRVGNIYTLGKRKHVLSIFVHPPSIGSGRQSMLKIRVHKWSDTMANKWRTMRNFLFISLHECFYCLNPIKSSFKFVLFSVVYFIFENVYLAKFIF